MPGGPPAELWIPVSGESVARTCHDRSVSEIRGRMDRKAMMETTPAALRLDRSSNLLVLPPIGHLGPEHPVSPLDLVTTRSLRPLHTPRPKVAVSTSSRRQCHLSLLSPTARQFLGQHSRTYPRLQVFVPSRRSSSATDWRPHASLAPIYPLRTIRTRRLDLEERALADNAMRYIPDCPTVQS